MTATAAPASSLDKADPRAIRQAIRRGEYRGFTNGLAPDYAQGNLVILPAAEAAGFRDYCAANPAAFSILGMSAAGDPRIPALAADMDLRTDVGEYMVFRDGMLVQLADDISALWRDDLVAFVLGCSFSFESVLRNHGVRLRHLEQGDVSPVYVTSLPTVPAGGFGGPLVVSMRALTPADAIKAITITARYANFHGAPVHIGRPALIGIADLSQSYGGHGMTEVRDDELPMFWACGATAQIAVARARPALCITHSKAHMVVTDLAVEGFALG